MSAKKLTKCVELAMYTSENLGENRVHVCLPLIK